ncbi:MAG: FAD binding domain-containing protein [Mycobacterium sp.]|nr:FAD binding domain-containing protein [Mycobacterium sp.]
MDQNTIEELVVPDPAAPGTGWREGDAWLAGGTFLHSLPLPHLRRFVDLSRMEWPAIHIVEDGLEIGPTCTVKQLLDFQPPPEWAAGGFLHDCVHAFLAGFKVWNTATVLGNICTSIPAGPMTTMACALEAEYTLWATDGSVRVVPAIEFVTGNNQNILAPGELLRKVNISGAALNRRYALRRFALTQAGRSSIFLVGTLDPTGEVLITVSAATKFPVHVRFPAPPSAQEVVDELDAQVPDDLYFDDPNGRPDHRKHMTYIFAEQIRAELAAD